MRRAPLISFLVLAIAAILAVASCSGADPTSTPVPVPPTEAAQPDPTAQPEPTEPPAATMAPAETATPFPTVTPFPTLTPTAEPGATPTATAAPRATATPEPTTAPTAAPRPLGALSPVENDLFGFAIDVPEAWALDEGSVLVRASDPEFGIPRLSVEVLLPTELGTNEDYGQIALELLESAAPEVVSEGAVTFDDGTEGYGYVLNVTAETSLRAHLYVVGRGSQVYQVFVGSVPGDFDARAGEFEAIAKSFRFRDPAPFGARLDRSLVMQSTTPSRFDPHLIENISSYRFAAQIFDGLVRLDRDLRVVPAMAESWDISDDGLVYDFHLHPDAVFHSGKPVTPEDVKWSFERAADPATDSRVSRLYIADIEGVEEKLDGEADEISGIEIVDEDTVRFRLTDPVPYFLAKMTHSAAFILNRENVEAGGERWALTPDGTGPFKVRGWTPGIVVVLDRHDAYHLGTPTVESVVIWLYGNPLLRYEAGEVDVASVGGLLGEEVRDPEHPLNAELKIVPSLTIFYVGFNTRVVPFDDPRARRALAMAVDPAALDIGLAPPVGFLPPGMPGFSEDLEPIPFDPVEAKRLWDEALADTDDFEAVRFQVFGSFVSPENEALAAMWQEHLGVGIEFVGTATNDLRGAIAESGAHVFEYGWVADYPDPENFLDVLFHSRSVNNTGRYTNAAVDRLLERARVEQDPDARFALYEEANRLMLEDTAAIPLGYQSDHILVKPYVRGWYLSAQDLWYMTEATVDKPTDV